MPRSRFFWATLALTVGAILAPTLGHAEKKKQLPTMRWTAGAPGCTFERRDDGRYLWTMIGPDLTVTLLVDSQELAKSRQRFYQLLGLYVSVTYTGRDKFEFPANLRIDFVRHHDVLEGYEDPSNSPINCRTTLIRRSSKPSVRSRGIPKSPRKKRLFCASIKR